MNEPAQLIDLLNKKEKLVAMVAPSFPIMYEPGEIVSKLKQLGFTYVVEVSAGAMKTNEEVAALLKNKPQSRFITSPCASFVRLVRTKHPDILPYLAFQADSPMVATARIVREKYPDCRPVFVGPCVAKKLESSEDYPELNILVINYAELNQILEKRGIKEVTDPHAKFDITAIPTRIYPFDGGLTYSGGVDKVLKPEEIRIVSGWKNCEAVLEEFKTNPKIRFVDVLFCEGGCINGPGVRSKLSLEERKQKVVDYANREVSQII